MAQGWTEWTNDVVDILRIMRLKKHDTFLLKEVYVSERILSKSHPRNQEIKAKIRQQLQVLRDYHYVRFVDNRGEYELLVDLHR